ncbi:MAG: lipoprotein [Bacteroidia bacterium]|nr:lipoprotein [Bacteroidia bacterium]
MRKIILIFSSILLLASCSQKQFTFRKKIKVNNAEIAVLKPIQNDVVSAPNPGKLRIDNQ